jgi:hypothetical protein
MFALGAIALAAAGLTFGLLLPPKARADDPPPSTVQTPTTPTPTLPTPDPAPQPKPKPKPAPKPATHVTPPARQSSPTPSYRAPVAPARSTPPAPVVRPKARVTSKPKQTKKSHIKKKAPVKKKTTVLPKVNVTPAAGALGASRTFQSGTGGSFGLASLLIVMSLGLAIACFTTAVVPATQVRWRRAAIFVSDRQVDIVLVGCALLTAGAFMVYWNKGR